MGHDEAVVRNRSCGRRTGRAIMRDRPGLFTPAKVGALGLPNRVVMSPMTRIRADEGCVPSERMVRYYAQRASAGLIITEGTHPSPMGRGYTLPPRPPPGGEGGGWGRGDDAGPRARGPGVGPL